MNDLERARALLHDDATDWIGVAELLRRSADPVVADYVSGVVRKEGFHERMSLEDRWLAERAFEKIHYPYRPAARIAPRYQERRLGEAAFEGIMRVPQHHALVAVLPLLFPIGRSVGVAVAAIELAYGTSFAPWQLGGTGLNFALLPSGHGYPYAVYDYIGDPGYVPLDFEPFFDLNPGCMWGEPLGPDVYAYVDQLDADQYEEHELLHTGSRLGGYRAFNALYVVEEAACGECGSPLWYAAHLASDIFDCTFGDAGSLHVMVCPRGCEARGMMDSA